MVYHLNLIGTLLVCLTAALNSNISFWWLFPTTVTAIIILESIFCKNNQWVAALTKIIFICSILFFLYKNPLFIGLYILTAGQILNLLVTAANKYKMPVDTRKHKNLFLPQGYIKASNETRLNFLGDFILIPFPGKGSLASPGDLIMCFGYYIAVIELVIR